VGAAHTRGRPVHFLRARARLAAAGHNGERPRERRGPAARRGLLASQAGPHHSLAGSGIPLRAPPPLDTLPGHGQPARPPPRPRRKIHESFRLGGSCGAPSGRGGAVQAGDFPFASCPPLPACPVQRGNQSQRVSATAAPGRDKDRGRHVTGTGGTRSASTARRITVPGLTTTTINKIPPPCSVIMVIVGARACGRASTPSLAS
jgi:hypothetical protein